MDLLEYYEIGKIKDKYERIKEEYENLVEALNIIKKAKAQSFYIRKSELKFDAISNGQEINVNIDILFLPDNIREDIYKTIKMEMEKKYLELKEKFDKIKIEGVSK